MFKVMNFMVLPGGRSDIPAPRQEPRMIVGGAAAPELCMKPMDARLPNGDELALMANSGHPLVKRWVQIKADGIGAKYIDGRIVTSEGVPMDCALHCQPGLARLEAAIGEPMFFDGEYVEEDGFNATVSAFQRREGHGTFWIYDAVPLRDWRLNSCPMKIEERLETLRSFMPAVDSVFVGMLDAQLLDPFEVQGLCQELWALGYEGVVSKARGSGYVRRRSEDWLRIKRILTEDLPIMDVIVEGGLLRKIMVRGPLGPITITSGWKQGYGAELVAAYAKWDHGDPPIIAEVSYQLTTGEKRSIRGATFHRARFDKGAKRP